MPPYICVIDKAAAVRKKEPGGAMQGTAIFGSSSSDLCVIKATFVCVSFLDN
jgi:hypothetical protein